MTFHLKAIDYGPRDEYIVCPKCGSIDIKTVDVAKLVAGCWRCGHHWVVVIGPAP
jgi:hypothetical protein